MEHDYGAILDLMESVLEEWIDPADKMSDYCDALDVQDIIESIEAEYDIFIQLDWDKEPAITVDSFIKYVITLL